MKAYYDHKPEPLEAVGNGSYRYHWNIQVFEPEDHEPTTNTTDAKENPRLTNYVCDELIIWPPLTENRLTEAVITEQFAQNYEQKLINDYNAVQLGILKDKDGAIAQRYKDFLQQRNELKQIVTADCQEAGILLTPHTPKTTLAPCPTEQ